MTGVVQFHGHLIAPTGLERLRLVVSVAVGQVQKLPRYQQRGAVRQHLAETHHDRSLGAVGCQIERNDGSPEHRKRLLERRRVEHHRHAVVGALVVRVIGRLALATPRPGVQAAGLATEDAALDGGPVGFIEAAVVQRPCGR